MDIRKVKKLIELLKESGIAEIEVCEGEESVRITQHSVEQQVVEMPPATLPVEPPVKPSTEGNRHTIKSPMVGTFYLRSSPDSPPFVEIGQSISSGEVLCIIEAMKIMNQIESDVVGTIRKIFIENGDPVEYGQSLFLIDR